MYGRVDVCESGNGCVKWEWEVDVWEQKNGCMGTEEWTVGMFLTHGLHPVLRLIESVLHLHVCGEDLTYHVYSRGPFSIKVTKILCGKG